MSWPEVRLFNLNSMFVFFSSLSLFLSCLLNRRFIMFKTMNNSTCCDTNCLTQTMLFGAFSVTKDCIFLPFLLNTLDLIIGMAQCCQLFEKWIPFCAQFHRNWVTIFEYLKYRENWFRLKMFQFDCVAILICLFYFFFPLDGAWKNCSFEY